MTAPFYVKKGKKYMSYDIAYNRQFIKTSRGVIPLVLIGSNNVTETRTTGHERRAREWAPYWQKRGAIEWAPAALMNKVAYGLPSEYNQHFKYHGRWVDDAGLLRFFQHGIKDALTLEELKDRAAFPSSVSLCGYVSLWDKSPTSFHHQIKVHEWMDTTEQLEIWLDKASAFVADDNGIHVCNICLAFQCEGICSGLKELQRKKSSREVRCKIRERGDFFVLRSSSNRYLVKLTSRHISTTSFADAAKPFSSKREAERYIAKYNFSLQNYEVFGLVVPKTA